VAVSFRASADDGAGWDWADRSEHDRATVISTQFGMTCAKGLDMTNDYHKAVSVG